MISYLEKDCSLEDLRYNGVENIKMKKSIKNNINDIKFYESVIDKNNTDHTSYAIESFLLFNESEKFGVFATESLNLLNNELNFIENISKKFSLEAKGLLQILTEEPNARNTTDVKRRSLLKRVWDSIIIAFQRLIGSVGNFIRSIMNNLASSNIKKMNKFYDDNYQKLSKVNVNNLNKVFRIIKVKNDIFKIIGNFSKGVLNMINVSKKFSIKMEEMIEIIRKIKSGKIYDYDTSFINRLKGYVDPNKFMYKLMDDVMDVISFKDTDVRNVITRSENIITNLRSQRIALNNPNDVVKMLFYGNLKAKTIQTKNVSGYLKNVPFNVLSKNFNSNMTTIMNTSKSVLKSLNGSMSLCRSTFKKLEEVSIRSVKSGDSVISQKALNIMTDYGNMSRRFNTFMVGIILNFYKEILRLQSYTYTIAKYCLIQDNTK